MNAMDKAKEIIRAEIKRRGLRQNDFDQVINMRPGYISSILARKKMSLTSLRTVAAEIPELWHQIRILERQTEPKVRKSRNTMAEFYVRPERHPELWKPVVIFPARMYP